MQTPLRPRHPPGFDGGFFFADRCVGEPTRHPPQLPANPHIPHTRSPLPYLPLIAPETPLVDR